MSFLESMFITALLLTGIISFGVSRSVLQFAPTGKAYSFAVENLNPESFGESDIPGQVFDYIEKRLQRAQRGLLPGELFPDQDFNPIRALR